MRPRCTYSYRLALCFSAAFLAAQLLSACQAGNQAPLPLIRPVEGGWISGVFGPREQHPVLGFSPGRMHEGYDFAVPEGTPVRATRAGTVRQVGFQGGYGKLVLIEHEDGYASLYGHLRDWWVQAGQMVEVGTPIAAVGQTGLSTGPHLHYEWLKDGSPIDPGTFETAVRMSTKPRLTELSRGAAPFVSDGAAVAVQWALLVRPERPARTGD